MNQNLLSGLCLDECSNYVLPNVFSPNGDGINDIYSSTADLLRGEGGYEDLQPWGSRYFKQKIRISTGMGRSAGHRSDWFPPEYIIIFVMCMNTAFGT